MNCTNKQQETCDVEKRTCEGCFYNEKTADEMFKELGYHNKFNNYYEHDFGTTIEFKSKYKEIIIRGSIDVKELVAINKKVQELGWKG